MKAGRTGAEAQRRRQNGSARGEKEEREKKGERGREPGRGTSDYVLSTVLWAEKREEEGKKERKRSERLKKGKGGEDRKKEGTGEGRQRRIITRARVITERGERGKRGKISQRGDGEHLATELLLYMRAN